MKAGQRVLEPSDIERARHLKRERYAYLKKAAARTNKAIAERFGVSEKTIQRIEL